jgi:glycosyltransferase involved in cell wall biosynthesis
MISIFSKFKIAGGSERRCVELANGIVNYLGLECSILCREENFPNNLYKDLDKKVNLVTDCLKKPDSFYNSEIILVVNTDSREFTRLSYWQNYLDMQRMQNKTMCFLFNFIISPSENLYEFENFNIKLGIITTNKKFYDEISNRDKFSKVKHIPRIILESPIDDKKLSLSNNTDKSLFNINFLSKSYDDKWNDDIVNLLKSLSSHNSENKKMQFNLMGVKNSLINDLSFIPNTNICKENTFSVNEFLSKCDVFVFYPSYKRQEPWARVIGEAMTCGLPIIALHNSGGTEAQVINGNNGFLCKNLQEFIDKIVYLFLNTDLTKKMGKNSKIYSIEFNSENICKKLLRFIDSINNL